MKKGKIRSINRMKSEMLLDREVTIVLATYNDQKYTREQVDSLVTKTYPI